MEEVNNTEEKEKEEGKPVKRKEKKRKVKKPIMILLIVFFFLVILFMLFLIIGNISLKIKMPEDYNTDVSVNSKSFEYPDVKCTFLGKEVSNLEITKDIDISQTGEQTLEYTCSKLMFKKTLKIKFTISDKEPPELKLNGNETISLYVGKKYEDKGATAVDNVDGDVTDKIVVEGVVDADTEGEYEIKYTVTDVAGNTATVTRKVTVKEKPAALSCGEAGTIYLTFDDGPDGSYTPVILNVLKKYDVKATFFVTNSGSDDLIKREFEEGHAVGLHTASHDYAKVYASDDAYWEDLNKVAARVKNITGQDATLVRFPGGSSNTVSRRYSSGIMTRLAEQLEDKGYSYFDWNVSSGDTGGTTDPDVEYNNVISSLSKTKGNVILMHDIKRHTSLAIENIVKYGLDHGYKFDVLNNDIICHQRINN